MIGIDMDELYEEISLFREVVFEYNKVTYVLQPESNDDKDYLVIWDCTPNVGKCIAKHAIPLTNKIPHNIINAVLSEKCFNGKSFLEIEKDIKVTTIF